MNTLGRHILVEYYNCDADILNDVMHIEASMVNAAKKAEATVINSTFHHFSPFGVSGVVVIQESHLAIHTWPDYGYAAVDIFTCGETVNPWICYNFLKEAFKSEYASAMEMQRGQTGLLKKTEHYVGEYGDNTPETIAYHRNVWFTERNENVAFSLRHKGDRLFAGQSSFQKVEVYDTFAYGRLLTLDGMVMTTERDEYVYHEMISHVAMQIHPNPKRVLIIGGGDGGVARELLRYPDVQVVMVEIDGMVIDASKQFLPQIASQFENPRLDLHVADGIDYVASAPDEAFDIVLVDSTDPVGPGEGLFTETFYRGVHRILRKDGIMITQSESPRFNTKVFQEIFQCYRGIFGENNVHCYLAYIPTYPTGMWSFSFSSKAPLDPVGSLDAAKAQAFSESNGLQYYDADIHRAAFSLPVFVKNLLKGK